MRTLEPSLASLAQSSWSLLSKALGGRIASKKLAFVGRPTISVILTLKSGDMRRYTGNFSAPDYLCQVLTSEVRGQAEIPQWLSV